MASRPVPVITDSVCLVALFGASALIARSHLMALGPELVGSAVLLDLVLTSALCHWILGVRRGGLPAWTSVPVAAVGLGISRAILPPDIGAAGLLPLAAMAVVEGATILLMVTRVTTVLAAFRAARATGAGRLSAIEAGVAALGPYAAPLARWGRLELEVWGFFFFGWYRRARAPSGATAFTHHEEAGWPSIAGAFGMLWVLEGAVLHLWLAQAGYAVAMWIALGIHVYGLVWIIGDAVALCVNRTCLVPAANGVEPVLELHVGVRARGRFPISSVVEVQTGTWSSAGPDERLVRVSGPANTKIVFERPLEFKPMLGAPIQIRSLLLQVDDPVRFERALIAARAARERPSGGGAL